jgi:hypothetical protein
MPRPACLSSFTLIPAKVFAASSKSDPIFGSILPRSSRHKHCSGAERLDTKIDSAKQRQAAEIRLGRNGGGAMANDDRDILELLKEELDFIEKGGYGRSVRTPWLAKSPFQDSLTCINYGYPYRAHPCSECRLLDFVSPEHRAAEVPCHHIPLNEKGETIEDLETQDNEAKLEHKLRDWLRAKIKEIEEERAQQVTV